MTDLASADLIQDLIHKNLLPIQTFLTDWRVRVTWIAFLTLWVLWGASWFARHAFGGDEAGNTAVATTGTTNAANADNTTSTDAAGNPIATGATTDPEAGMKRYAAAPVWSQRIFHRLNRAHDMLRDLLLMLLSVLTLNTFARASTYAVMILAWIFVAFAVIWFAIEAVVEHRWLRFGYSILFFGIALAIGGLAYAQGFYA